MSSVPEKKRADIKVVIIGDAFVGKTTFIRRYMERTFSDNVGTVGACFFLKQWGNYNIAIWDTAGEERFSGLSSFYCRDASAAIVAFDLSNQRSFELLSERYLPLLDAAKEDCLLCVTGMKLDLLSEESRPIPRQEAESFALHLNRGRFKEGEDAGSDAIQKPYFETSSLTGQNVDQVFDFIFSTVLPAGRDLSSSHQQGTRPSHGIVEVDSNNLREISGPKAKNCCK